MPTPRRAAFIMANMAFRPLFGSPTSQPVAPSKFITQVALPWMPILCSIEPQLMPLRSPGVALGVGQELRHDEQRDALGALRRVRQARQHEVDDVLGHVVLAAGDEDLGAGDRIGARRPVGSALVRRMPRSVPQCGSVRHMVPVHSPDTSFGR